jgi:hypothetical protein
MRLDCTAVDVARLIRRADRAGQRPTIEWAAVADLTWLASEPRGSAPRAASSRTMLRASAAIGGENWLCTPARSSGLYAMSVLCPVGHHPREADSLSTAKKRNSRCSTADVPLTIGRGRFAAAPHCAGESAARPVSRRHVIDTGCSDTGPRGHRPSIGVARCSRFPGPPDSHDRQSTRASRY